MKAVCYVRDVDLKCDVVTCDYQRALIQKHVKENNIEVVAWITDLADIFNYDYDVLLVERVWAISRSYGAVEEVLKELVKHGLRLEAVTTMWDCTSQKVRSFGRNEVEHKNEIEVSASTYKVKKPAKLHFAWI